ncbi:hypothetical protein [Roseibium alexandrii]|uniref:Uncharacterized protein n=1 Tax=Roseibium alexandrii (strain DSM 17067 / NCIMB 14079 / DFL-11) TaxID=244592 RepID=A0A5E8H2H0_ROSAD|nr:hypothetical protein [Roseibium alexandrii]EEE45522.2 hypothetical protein SADFL11_2811 [Roseibium alexandrii DFL-11]
MTYLQLHTEILASLRTNAANPIALDAEIRALRGKAGDGLVIQALMHSAAEYYSAWALLHFHTQSALALDNKPPKVTNGEPDRCQAP